MKDDFPPNFFRDPGDYLIRLKARFAKRAGCEISDEKLLEHLECVINERHRSILSTGLSGQPTAFLRELRDYLKNPPPERPAEQVKIEQVPRSAPKRTMLDLYPDK